MFVGGEENSTSYLASVEVYNSSLVKSAAPDLNSAREKLSGTTVGSYALFGGGYVV